MLHLLKIDCFPFGFLLYIFRSYNFIPLNSVICSYSPKYVKDYIEGAQPLLSVGEYLDVCNYNGSTLDYNQGMLKILIHEINEYFLVAKYVNTLPFQYFFCIVHLAHLFFTFCR